MSLVSYSITCVPINMGRWSAYEFEQWYQSGHGQTTTVYVPQGKEKQMSWSTGITIPEATSHDLHDPAIREIHRSQHIDKIEHPEQANNSPEIHDHVNAALDAAHIAASALRHRPGKDVQVVLSGHAGGDAEHEEDSIQVHVRHTTPVKKTA